MKNFIIKIFCFTLILFAFCFCLSEVEFSDDFIVEKTTDTAYEKVCWNLDMIRNHSNKIENSTIFLGSSYILGGVNDSILNSQGHNAHNFGVRHNGNDLNLYFLRRLAPLNPKAIYFLKSKTNFSELHKLTPLLIRPSILIKDGQTINLTFVSYLFKRVKLVVEYLFYTNEDDISEHRSSHNDFGIVYDEKQISKTDFNSKETVERMRRTQERFSIYKNGYLFAEEKLNDSFQNKIKALKRKLTLKFYSENNFITNCDSQNNFIETAKGICKDKSIGFYQLYIPVVSDIRPFANYEGELYRKKESDFHIVVFENYYFLNNYLYWADEHHLTKTGAEIFTKKISNKFF